MKLLVALLLLTIVGCVTAATAPIVTGLTPDQIQSMRRDAQQEQTRVAVGLQPALADANSIPINNPFLWKIVSKDGTRTVGYLLGTMHLGIRAKDLPPAVLRRFRQARVVVVESDTRAKPKKANQDDQKLLLQVVDGNGASEASIADASSAALASYEHEMQPWNPEFLEKLGPDAAFNLFKLMKSLECAGSQRSFLDRDLQQRARKMKKAVRFLESTADLIDAFSAGGASNVASNTPRVMSIDEFNAVFERDPTDEIIRECKEIAIDIASYRLGNLEGELAQKVERMQPDAYRILIKGRNQRWIGKLEPILDDGGAFIAVGVGHMVGPSSLIGMLRERGYQVTRVPALTAVQANASLP